MLALHIALLEWLILGTSPLLWDGGCLYIDITAPTRVHQGPYPTTSIAAANLLPKGIPWRLFYLSSFEHPASVAHHITIPPTQPLHARAPLTSRSPVTHDLAMTPNPELIIPTLGLIDQPPKGHLSYPAQSSIPNPPREDTNFVLRAIRIQLHLEEATVQTSAQRLPSRGSSHTPLITQGDIKNRLKLAKMRHTRRLKTCHTSRQTMLVDHWPTLRPASLPERNRSETRTPLLPRSLHSMGWRADPNHTIRQNHHATEPFPFPHSPQGTPSPSTSSDPPHHPEEAPPHGMAST
jgi:hypothetical protein